MTIATTQGIDALVDAPPLTDPPLSLLSKGVAIPLVSNEGQVEARRVAAERAASAEMQLKLLEEAAPDATSTPDELNQLRSEYYAALDAVAQYDSSAADLERWTQGFVYLPELGNAEAVEAISPYANGTGITPSKMAGNNQSATLWYDPFLVVALDSRSAFGWPYTDYESRALRAERALRKHESWQCEAEFWSGVQVPTNYHLTASTETPTTSPRRTITAFSDPTPAPGTVLGTAYGLGQSLAALDQAIAEVDAGTGIVHATPYVVQQWMRIFPFIRDSNGLIYTVNHNLLLPGYGYGGTGPDTASRSETDGVTTSGDATFTSASAAFTSADIGRQIVETDDKGVVPANTYIVAITSSTVAATNNAATGDATGINYTIGGQGGRAGGAPKQWAYATDAVYRLIGDVSHYPYDLRELSPNLVVDNLAEARAERSNAFITNQLLRAAVLVDTTTA